MRKHFGFQLAITLLGSSLAAHADTIYNFTLTSADGYAGGSGSFALNVAPPATGTAIYSFYQGEPLGYQINSFVQSYTPPPGGFDATDYGDPLFGVQEIAFVNGTLSSLDGFVFHGGTPSCQSFVNIGATSYIYRETCNPYSEFSQFYSDSGTVTVTPAVTPGAVTPEPSGLVLLGTAMLGLVGVARRRLL